MCFNRSIILILQFTFACQNIPLVYPKGVIIYAQTDQIIKLPSNIHTNFAKETKFFPDGVGEI